MKTNDGGPAFPQVWHPDMRCDPANTPAGMPLRDWLAGNETITDIDASDKTLEALEALAGREYPSKGSAMDRLRWEADWRAALRYLRADAMLAARERGR